MHSNFRYASTPNNTDITVKFSKRVTSVFVFLWSNWIPKRQCTYLVGVLNNNPIILQESKSGGCRFERIATQNTDGRKLKIKTWQKRILQRGVMLVRRKLPSTIYKYSRTFNVSATVSASVYQSNRKGKHLLWWAPYKELVKISEHQIKPVTIHKPTHNVWSHPSEITGLITGLNKQNLERKLQNNILGSWNVISLLNNDRRHQINHKIQEPTLQTRNQLKGLKIHDDDCWKEVRLS